MLALLVLSWLTATCMGSLTILEPIALKAEIAYSVSTFGFVDYQADRLVEVRSWSNEDGCEPPTDEILESKGQNIGYLMKKGECNFRRQALNAHRAGAYVVFTYMDRDGEDHLVTPTGQEQDSKDTVLPPVVMISKKNGESIKAALKKGEKVRIRVDFDIKTIQPPVDVALFYSAVDINSIEIYYSLMKFHLISTYQNTTLKKKEIMRLEAIPRLYTKKSFNFTDADQMKFCLKSMDLCVNPHPSVTLRESTDEIRVAGFLLCLQDNLANGENKENLEEFIKILGDYYDLLKIHMENSGVLDAKEHFHSYFRNESVFIKKSVQCYKNNLGEENNDKKSALPLLQKISQWEGSKIKIPSLFIQDNLVKGDISAMTSVSAVCDVLSKKYKPAECYSIEEVLSKTADKLLAQHEGPSRMTIISSLAVIFGISCLLIGLIYVVSTTLLQRRIRADIISEIDESLEKYYQIQNTKLETVSRDSELMANNA